jgi:tetrahydromethanopterin S-methyltransferase subunit G
MGMIETTDGPRKPDLAPIDMLFAKVDDRLDRLEHSIDQMISKIVPVLGPEGPEPARADGDGLPEMSAVARVLFQMENRIDRIADKVQYQTDRIEL